MSFDTILVLCSMIFCFLVVHISLKGQREAFKQGFEYGREVKIEEKPVKSKKTTKKTEETDETRRLNQLLANIDAYDGTGLGQKEIK
jgi:mannitol-specific phosphotransferase system IIBC component